jgi:hypothetical protein
MNATTEVSGSRYADACELFEPLLVLGKAALLLIRKVIQRVS